MNNFYAVFVSPTRYHNAQLLAAQTLHEAAVEILGHARTQWCDYPVLRDGSNARRYSFAECEAIAKRAV